MPEGSLERIRDVDVAQELQQSYIDYAMSVITQRALPDVRDGLLPVQRRILYAMHVSGNIHERGFRKSAKTVGEVIGNFHPHGDVAVYESMVHLAQDFSLRYPLVDGHGNFGSIDGDPPAAMRYTEARLTRLAGELLRDIDKDTVEFVSNYDDTTTEPLVLPSRFPNVLCNGAMGIAVGMSTDIAPHNLREVIAATVAMIENPELSTAELRRFITGPDFPTGGKILGTRGIVEAFESGRGRFTLRGRAEIVEARGDRLQIVITEIPYRTRKSALIERIAALYKEKRLEGISGLTDESDRHGMRIVIDVQRGADAQALLHKLYRETPLQQTYSVRTLALVNGRPIMLGVKRVLQEYIQHQREVVLRRTRFELARAEKRAEILRGLLTALDHLEEVIALIRGSRARAEARAGLQERFGLSEVQADAILDMRLVQLTGLEREKLQQELDELDRLIAHLNAILQSEQELLAVIKGELTDIAEQFGDERRTEIISDADADDGWDEVIVSETVAVTVTQAGYIKRLPLDTYRSQGRGGRGITATAMRENDFVTQLFSADTRDYALFFTSLGRVFRLRVHEIPEASRTARGTAAINLLALGEGEHLSAVIPIREADLEESSEADPEDSDKICLVLATRNGMVKRMRLSDLKYVRRPGIIAIGLQEGDRLIGVRMCSPNDEVLVGTRRGRAIRFLLREARVMGRTARGVRGMRLATDDEVIGLAVGEPGSDVLLVSERGIGKRTPLDDFPTHHRGGSGLRAQRLSPKSGALVALRVVHPDDEVMLISAGGILTRQAVAGISRQSRSAGGVLLMRLDADDTVVSVASLPGGEEGEADGDGEQVQETED